MIQLFKLLMSADAKHAASAKSATVFPIGTYVSCRYTDRPPTRLHTTWHGLYRVIYYKGFEYVLANLVTDKERSVHIKNLNFFNYDSEVMYLLLTLFVVTTWNL